ncbi:hypothetical protein GCM10007063_18860 [Lentibacillus kapialis]|uniref:Uncharacterized protein n=1 Tax=Lentibacillus kapialis TaxID=340214 RepID=A0A917PWE6_9BACI|nr:CBO0543 family protein [Lentibacillus kapialis]GGJ96633.1 hypothetical protein GCM10007063_18860 [Lentibacillus kapialis]
MERILLWLFLIIGIVLLIKSFKKNPLQEWLLGYLLAAHLAVFLGQLVVNYQLLSYPVKLFPSFESSVLYEYLLLPIISVGYYYQTSSWTSISRLLGMALLSSAALTIFEVILEKNTDLIQYIHWYWYDSLISIFVFLLMIRFLMKQIVTSGRGRND